MHVDLLIFGSSTVVVASFCIRLLVIILKMKTFIAVFAIDHKTIHPQLPTVTVDRYLGVESQKAECLASDASLANDSYIVRMAEFCHTPKQAYSCLVLA